MTLQERTQHLAENVTLIIVARLAMVATPIVLAALVWFAASWLDQRFDVQKTATDIVSVRVDGLQSSVDTLGSNAVALANRVIVLETGSARGRQDRQAFQDDISADIKDMRNALVSLSNNVAALTATVQALKERQAMNFAPHERSP
jgi:hypothetical protein